MQKVPELKDVCEPHVAGADTPKPYAVIRQGLDTDESPWLGFRRVVEIWPYVERTSFDEVDKLQEAIVNALHGELIADEQTGEVFSCLFLGSASEDIVDEEWDVITRGLSFAVIALQPVKQEEQIEADSWITALATWTETFLGEGWSVYQNYLPMGYKRPAMLWRLKSHAIEAVNRGLCEVQKDIIGHVIGLSNSQETTVATNIVHELGATIKVPLSVAERRYITIEQPRADYQADNLNSGQITLKARRRTNKPAEDAPIIASVTGSGEMR